MMRMDIFETSTVRCIEFMLIFAARDTTILYRDDIDKKCALTKCTAQTVSKETSPMSVKQMDGNELNDIVGKSLEKEANQLIADTNEVHFPETQNVTTTND